MENIDKKIEREKLLFNLECDFITDFIALRKSMNLSQQSLADKAGVLRGNVVRIENSIVSPCISTLLKILSSIGYTIKIVPIEEENNNK